LFNVLLRLVISCKKRVQRTEHSDAMPVTPSAQFVLAYYIMTVMPEVAMSSPTNGLLGWQVTDWIRVAQDRDHEPG